MYSTFQHLSPCLKKYVLYDGLYVFIKRILFLKNL